MKERVLKKDTSSKVFTDAYEYGVMAIELGNL